MCWRNSPQFLRRHTPKNAFSRIGIVSSNVCSQTGGSPPSWYEHILCRWHTPAANNIATCRKAKQSARVRDIWENRACELIMQSLFFPLLSWSGGLETPDLLPPFFSVFNSIRRALSADISHSKDLLLFSIFVRFCEIVTKLRVRAYVCVLAAKVKASHWFASVCVVDAIATGVRNYRPWHILI